MDLNDKERTGYHNAMNCTRWQREANGKNLRLALTIGIHANSEFELFLATQIPPGELVKILRSAADGLEQMHSGKIILLNG